MNEPRGPRRHLVAGLLASVALLAAACAQDRGNPWAEPLPSPTAPEEPDAATGDAPRVVRTAAATVRLIDGECFLAEARCGIALVPETGTDPDLVELGFRVVTDEGEGDPVVLIEHADLPLEFDPATLPGRPLVAITTRGWWPGGPTVACPEWRGIEGEIGSEAEHASIVSLTARCAARIEAAGVDLEAFDRATLAADVAAVADALGLVAYDVIAPYSRADLVAAMVDGGAAVDDVVYVNGRFAGDDLIGGWADEIVATLDAVWARCDQLTTCPTAGTAEEFLDAIAALDRAPLPRDGGLPVDAGTFANAVFGEMSQPADAAYLPTIHAQLLERDVTALLAFVDAGSGSAEASGLTRLCGDLAASPPASVGRHPVVAAWVERAAGFYDAACAGWIDVAPTVPLPTVAGLDLRTATDEGAAAAGPGLVEPTVGPVSERCIMTAALAWFDRGEVDDADCREPLAIGSRTLDFALVPGAYDYDDSLTVHTSVPDTWTDYGSGTWYRDADPVDLTVLDLYVWFAPDAAAAREQMAEEFFLLEPVTSTRVVDGRTWLEVTGTEDFGAGDYGYTIAVADIDGVNVAVVLGGDLTELTDLAGSVLEPALAAVRVEQ